MVKMLKCLALLLTLGACAMEVDSRPVHLNVAGLIGAVKIDGHYPRRVRQDFRIRPPSGKITWTPARGKVTSTVH